MVKSWPVWSSTRPNLRPALRKWVSKIRKKSIPPKTLRRARILCSPLPALRSEILARLVINTPELEARIEKMGIKDKKKIYTAKDLAPGKNLVFAATGVTDGALMKGVRFFGEGTRTSSIVMTRHSGKVRFVESIHLAKRADVKVRFM